MFSRSKIIDEGDTNFSNGEVVGNSLIEEENRNVKNEGKTPAKSDSLIMGITEVSLTRQSFLSAASFQHTSKILINAAVRGSKDTLQGLKENVIVGRLIPAGSGFEGSPKNQKIRAVQEELDREFEGKEE